MIARDEAGFIERSLAGARGLAEEIVVVDTGSGDETREKAAALGARVFSLPWRDDFAEARNAALARATGRWILMLDADEVIEPRSAAGLRSRLTRTPELRFNVEVISLMGDGGQSQRTAITRLFRREGHRYAGRVHEQLQYEGRPAPPGPPSGLRLLHYGYLEERMRARDKFGRNLRLLMREWEERPDPYVAHQIAATHDAAGDPRTALAWFERARDLQGGYDARLLKDTVHCLKNQGRTEAALRLAQEGIRRYPDYTDLHFLAGTLNLELGRVPEAEAAFLACVKRGEAPPCYQSTQGVGTYLAHYNLGVLYEVSGDRARAAFHYRAAARAGYRPAEVRLGAL